jgi:hypothetical protein
MRHSLVFIFAVGFIFAFYGFTDHFGKPAPVKAEDLKAWIDYLASDEMRGRANGSPEMILAAGWLAGKFREFGLKPIPAGSDYVQNYSYTSRQHTVNERNVIGVIEGSNPQLKDQFIIITAHFDHIGVRKGNDPDSIYNGADDNAAGTCTLLGIAKTIMDSGIKPGRTLIFAAFSGEEKGMRGSRYFVTNPPISLSKIYADINFEMTGHSEFLGKNRYYMTGCRISDLDDLIGEYNKNSVWQLIDTIPLANNLFFDSDNIAFSRITSIDGISHGVPSGTFATTALADYIHSPHDEGKLFDYENMAGLVDYFSNIIIWLSENKSEVRFTDPGFKRLSN